MGIKNIICAAAIALNLTLSCELGAQAENAVVSTGFTDGVEYLNLSESAKLTYVSGLVDGLLGSPVFFGDNSERERRFRSCIDGLYISQLRDLLTQYLMENPLQRSNNNGWSLILAVDEHCPIFQSPGNK